MAEVGEVAGRDSRNPALSDNISRLCSIADIPSQVSSRGLIVHQEELISFRRFCKKHFEASTSVQTISGSGPALNRRFACIHSLGDGVPTHPTRLNPSINPIK